MGDNELIAYKIVTEKQKESRIKNKKQKKKQVFCPHCGKTFAIEI